jgi:hypothetical protein
MGNGVKGQAKTGPWQRVFLAFFVNIILLVGRLLDRHVLEVDGVELGLAQICIYKAYFSGYGDGKGSRSTSISDDRGLGGKRF